METPAPQRDTADGPLSEESDGAIPRGRETILVVEDDPFVRALLRRMLESLGYLVHLAASGAEALALHDQHGARIALVLCDVVLPGISGPNTIHHILAASTRPPAVIFMSGHTDHALLRDGRLTEGRAFLQKPLLRPQLARALREALAPAMEAPL